MSPIRLDALRERWVQRLGLARFAPRPEVFDLTRAPPDSAPGCDITVLIPAFQHERYITEALRSVLAQTYQGFEVLVVDDCSRDRTVARARSVADARITTRVNERNRGLGGSLVAAVEGIRTPFVALLNSDDLFHPERLERCRDLLLRDPGLRMVATGIVLTDSRSGRLTPERASRILDGRRIFHWVRWYGRIQSTATGSESLFLRLLRHNFLLSSSNIVCQTSYLREQAADLSELHYCLDWHLFLTAAAAGELGYLPERLLAYRLHHANTVWFTPRTRPAYAVEVNRVAALAVRRYLARMDSAEVEARFSEVAGCLAANPEIDGPGLCRDEILPRLTAISNKAATRFRAPPD
jgi:glycosyltransferase involved in cell wall biosynthesis